MYRKILLILIILWGVSLWQAGLVSAQFMSLTPASATKKVGEEFTVTLEINGEGKAVAGADAKITFDASLLEITGVGEVGVANGGFFTDEAHNIGDGTLYIAGFFKEQFATKTGIGKMVTITLKGKKTGTAAVNFVCTPQTNDTNVLDASANDIINCSGTKGGSYIIIASGGEGTPTATPTATPTPIPGTARTPTPTPPVSGIALPTIFSLGAGILLTIAGIAFIF